MYDMYLDMVRDGVTWFRWRNNIIKKKEIAVATNEIEVDTDTDGFSDIWEEANGRLYWHPDDGLPLKATNPLPGNGLTGVPVDTDLSWTTGVEATSHNVYFGESNSPDYKHNQAETFFDPGVLQNGRLYYWRIDEVNAKGTTIGDIWTFTTALRQVSDFDHDGDVDLEDFGHFQVCLTGPGISQNDPDCADARLDEDQDVDQDDFGIFMDCFSGAAVPAAPNCTG
jgi:hypothetical protein